MLNFDKIWKHVYQFTGFWEWGLTVIQILHTFDTLGIGVKIFNFFLRKSYFPKLNNNMSLRIS